MSAAIGLAGFQARFADDPDPWNTFEGHDEAVKRRAILHALGPAPLGRVLELASGNGSNSRALAPRARRLHATEGTVAGTKLTAAAIARWRHARALTLPLPASPPWPRYEAVVVAELLYYLQPRAMAAVARMVARVLPPGGRLVLAHHRIDFHDFAQHADGIHRRFLAASGAAWRCRPVRRTGRWRVDVAERVA